MLATRILTLSILMLALSNCGFALRGSDMLSANFTSLQFYSEQPNSDFSRLLRRSLESADVDVTVVDEMGADPDIPLLGIVSEQLITRPVTINPRARAAQIELRLSVVAALQLGGQTLMEPETLFVERVYFQDIENISGNQEEAEIISGEMRRDLINQLMRRLSATEPV